MAKYTDWEVREAADAIESKQMLVSSMLRAFADMLAAAEKADAERESLCAEVELLTRGRQADQDMAVAANERAIKAESEVERLREELFQVRRAHTEMLGCFNALANRYDRDCKRAPRGG